VDFNTNEKQSGEGRKRWRERIQIREAKCSPMLIMFSAMTPRPTKRFMPGIFSGDRRECRIECLSQVPRQPQTDSTHDFLVPRPRGSVANSGLP
jgi:hypothetical protein